MRRAELGGAAIYRQRRRAEGTCVPDVWWEGSGCGWNRGEGRLASSRRRETKHLGVGGPARAPRRSSSVVSVATEYIKAGTAMANGICDLHAR